MKNIKKILSLSLALLFLLILSPKSFAEEKVKANDKQQQIQTLTIQGNYRPMFYNNDNSKTVTSYKSLGLTLAPGKSDWSVPVEFNFNSLPANARIMKFKFDHGPAKTGAPKLLGAILLSRLRISNPNGKSQITSWTPGSPEELNVFLYSEARGVWRISMFGTNIARPTGNYYQDLRFWGNVSYYAPKVTIEYTIE